MAVEKALTITAVSSQEKIPRQFWQKIRGIPIPSRIFGARIQNGGILTGEERIRHELSSGLGN